jgi:hypothetical protein
MTCSWNGQGVVEKVAVVTTTKTTRRAQAEPNRLAAPPEGLHLMSLDEVEQRLTTQSDQTGRERVLN